MTPITPKEIRYIKLGPGGGWAETALAENELAFGYSSIKHENCLRGDWAAVLRDLQAGGRVSGKATDALREIRDFYERGPDCLWITFVNDHLWWAYAEPVVTWIGEPRDGRGARTRKVIGTWCRTDVFGVPLKIHNLSTRLTQVAAYRQTICNVKAADYLVRRINGIPEPILVRAKDARSTMIDVAIEMIQSLDWASFEILVDLIFTRSGWQRSSSVGGIQKDVDLILEQPTTSEIAFVQVKSKADQSVLDDYVERYRQAGSFDRFFFVCHSPQGNLKVGADKNLHLWTQETLADAAVKAGLFDWLTLKCA